MTADTPFARNPQTGRIHLRSCHAKGLAIDLALPALLRSPIPVSPYGWVISASCCSASPGAWLDQNYPGLLTPADAPGGAP